MNATSLFTNFISVAPRGVHGWGVRKHTCKAGIRSNLDLGGGASITIDPRDSKDVTFQRLVLLQKWGIPVMPHDQLNFDRTTNQPNSSRVPLPTYRTILHQDINLRDTVSHRLWCLGASSIDTSGIFYQERLSYIFRFL